MALSLRIALTGSYSVGKSSLAAELAKTLDLPLINGVAREVALSFGIDSFDDPTKIDRETLLKYQDAVLSKQLEMEEQFRSTGFVSERTTVDNMVFYILKARDRFVDPERSIAYYKTAVTNLVNYDYLVFVPREFEGQPDGFRYYKEPDREEFEFMLSLIMLMFSLDGTTIVATGNPSERVATVLNKIYTDAGVM